MPVPVRHDRRYNLSKATQAVPVGVGGGLALAPYNGFVFGHGTMVDGWGGLLGPGTRHADRGEDPSAPRPVHRQAGAPGAKMPPASADAVAP